MTTAVGSDRPKLSDLYKHVVPYMGKKWEDLAYRLLQEDDTYHISRISYDNKTKDVTECAKEMLQLWLSMSYPDTTWNKLISELKEKPVELRFLAQQIEDKMLPGTETECVCVCACVHVHVCACVHTHMCVCM